MRSRLFLVLVSITVLLTPAFAQKRNITEKDLFNFVWIADPQVAPDGSRVAFVRVTVNQRKDGYDTAIWTVSTATGESRQLTAGPRDSSPRWSPDGKFICFVRSPEKDGRPEPPQLFMLSMDGGEAWQFTTLPRGAGGPQWSADGKMISFGNGATTEEIAKQKETLPVPPPPGAMPPAASPTPAASPKPPERESDVRVITRAVYRSNDSGYLDFKHPVHVWVVSAPRTGEDKVTPKQLTNGRYSDGNVTWAKDSSRIYFVSDHRDEPYYELGKTDVYYIAVSGGQETDVTTSNQSVQSFRTTPDSSKIVLLISTPTRIGDLFWMEKPGAPPKQLTHVNDDLFSKLNLTEPEEIWYTSFDGKKIHTWVQKPPNFDPSKKYPLVLNIHGGPHAAYGWVFDHEFQWMAAKGYVVLYPNPRGSTTYGQDFGNIIQYHYPGDDYKDLMIGVDEMVKRGYIDEKKMGVTGGSGGGLLTDWTVGHTTRFAAAVAQRDIASWADWWYTADFTLFQATWFKAAPFDDPEDFKARSPITYINNVKTPMMFILGEADWRTPTYAGGEEMFRALKYKKIPTVMVRFPNETHELSRSGQPWHRIERLEHIVGWFDKWLMGMKKPEYEVGGER